MASATTPAGGNVVALSALGESVLVARDGHEPLKLFTWDSDSNGLHLARELLIHLKPKDVCLLSSVGDAVVVGEDPSKTEVPPLRCLDCKAGCEPMDLDVSVLGPLVRIGDSSQCLAVVHLHGDPLVTGLMLLPSREPIALECPLEEDHVPPETTTGDGRQLLYELCKTCYDIRHGNLAVFWARNLRKASGYCLAVYAYVYESAMWTCKLDWYCQFDDLKTAPEQVLICSDLSVRFVVSGSVWDCAKHTERTQVFPLEDSADTTRIRRLVQAGEEFLGVHAGTGSLIRLSDSGALADSTEGSTILEPISKTHSVYFVGKDNTVTRI